jgi:hypothetical protein
VRPFPRHGQGSSMAISTGAGTGALHTGKGQQTVNGMGLVPPQWQTNYWPSQPECLIGTFLGDGGEKKASPEFRTGL